MSKIVMIEDDFDLCEGWTDVLNLLGHEITCFQRALPALEHLRADATCDLLITDYYLPDLNGVELAKQVREYRPKLPVILLTGSRETEILMSARQLPVCEVLHKPLNIDDLELRIGKMVGTG